LKEEKKISNRKQRPFTYMDKGDYNQSGRLIRKETRPNERVGEEKEETWEDTLTKITKLGMTEGVGAPNSRRPHQKIHRGGK